MRDERAARGSVPGPFGGSALATNGLLHDEVMALLDPLPGSSN